jgi:MoaA/NifB/PqqE/SkfB family radical SAM enzyme
MSTYNDSADKAEKQLKNISSTMCYAKWAQVSIHLTNGMTQSCYHPPLHKINIEDIKKNPSALHNTKQKKDERKQMLAGERPSGCSYCWKIEDVGGRSDRIYRSGEYWAQDSRADIVEALDTGDINPRYVEVNFNQACNFKCMYCSPHLSTTWEEEIKEYGPYQIVDNDLKKIGHNDITYLERDGFMPLRTARKENPYVEAFWNWWPKLYKTLSVFRMTGGEPLMDSNTFRILDYIYTHPNNQLELSITSNLCPPKKDLMKKFVDKIKKLEEIQIWEDKEKFNPGSGNHWYVNMALKNLALFVSVDSVDEQAEYIRDGLKFNILKENIETILNETVNTTITFINTFNILSVPKFTEFLKYILELRKKHSKEIQGIKYIPIYDPNYKHPDYVVNPKQRIRFDVPILRNPAWQSIQILTPDFEQYLEEALDFMKANPMKDFVGFSEFEIEKVERNLVLMREGQNLDEHKLYIDRINFVKFYDQYDERKNTKLLTNFPELKDFYNFCKNQK